MPSLKSHGGLPSPADGALIDEGVSAMKRSFASIVAAAVAAALAASCASLTGLCLAACSGASSAADGGGSDAVADRHVSHTSSDGGTGSDGGRDGAVRHDAASGHDASSLPDGSATTDASSGPPHVMILNMENQSIGDIIGNGAAPYQNSLANQYQTFTQSYGVGHYSLDNYLAQISGRFYSASTGDCSPGGSCSFSDATLASQLDSAGVPWAAFMGSMTRNAETSDDDGNGNGYGVRHDPFVYYPSLVSADRAKIQPAGTAANWDGETNLINTLNHGAPPALVFYSPSICQDGGGDMAPNCSGGAGIAAGDSFLSSVIPQIEATTWYQNKGVIVLTYDEGDGGTQGESLTGSGNNVLTVVISAATVGAAASSSYLNQFGVLAGLEKRYGVPCLGEACTSSNGSLPLP
jgi:hypothetical protein